MAARPATKPEADLVATLVEIKSGLATMSARIEATETDYQRLSEVQRDLATKMERGFADIGRQISARDKTPWPVIFSGFGVTLALAVAIGSLALSPLRDKDAALAEDLHAVRAAAEKLPSREEIDAKIRAMVAKARLSAK